jgi:hypothetical protein
MTLIVADIGPLNYLIQIGAVGAALAFAVRAIDQDLMLSDFRSDGCLFCFDSSVDAMSTYARQHG